jgi:hypothetical protein
VQNASTVEEEEMMGRFGYWRNVSLDLRIEQVPGVNGAGEWLLDEYDVPIGLDLLAQRSFGQGVTMHRYAIRDEFEAGPC